VLAAGTKGTKAVGNTASKILKRTLPFKDPDRIREINKTLDLVESGGPFPFVLDDGKIFNNREGLLPKGDYREYTVVTPGLSHRGKRRILRDVNTEKIFYTDDHYKTFIEIDPAKR